MGALALGSPLSSDQTQALHDCPDKVTSPHDEVEPQPLGWQLQRAQSQTDGTRRNGCILGLGGSRQDIENLFFPMPWDRSPDGFFQDSDRQSHGHLALGLEIVLLPVGGWSGDPQDPSTSPAGILCPQQYVSSQSGTFLFVLHAAPSDSFQLHPFQENIPAFSNQMEELMSFRNDCVFQCYY